MKRGNVSSGGHQVSPLSSDGPPSVSAPSARGWRSGRDFSSDDDFVPAANAVGGNDVGLAFAVARLPESSIYR